MNKIDKFKICPEYSPPTKSKTFSTAMTGLEVNLHHLSMTICIDNSKNISTAKRKRREGNITTCRKVEQTKERNKKWKQTEQRQQKQIGDWM